ncbi:MAG: hypothetical protein RL685_6511 [Pseudomonadota bacterium]|jgi:ABC-2 type transport system permease protein
MFERRALHKVLVVFQREYAATVRTKAFLIALVSLPLLTLLAVGVPFLATLGARPAELYCIVLDQSGGTLARALEQAAARHNRGQPAAPALAAESRIRIEAWSAPAGPEAQRTLVESVRSGELFGFVEIGADVFDLEREQLAVRYHARFTGRPLLQAWLSAELTPAIHRERLARAALDASLVERAQAPVQLLDPSALAAQAGAPQATPRDLALPALAALLMFLAMMLGAAPLMQSVLEEKSQRIAEILISSVPPFQLLLGKLLGASAVSLLLLGVYFGGGFVLALALGHGAWFTAYNVACLLLFQLIALLLYGGVFLAIGSLCSDLRESQTLMLPTMVLSSTPLLILPLVLAEPHSDLATGLSLVPFFTPLLMMVRATVVPAAPGWQVLLGAALSGSTAIVCVAFAGRCLRVGLLSRGPAPRLRELGRWLRQV